MCAALVAQSGASSQTTRRRPPQRQTSASGLEQNKTLVREFYVPFNTGAVERFDAVLAPNWVEHPAGVSDQQPGREAYKPIIRDLRSTGGMFDELRCKCLLPDEIVQDKVFRD